jgi:predicted O-linked N-acetylglucosamine transferase (SPINDLY family)
MGVPVITLAGDTPFSRVGLSLLMNLGLDEWVSYSPEDYLNRVILLADDQGQLTHYRQTLRKKLSHSVLCNGQAFADQWETLFRQLWHRWCDGLN